VIHGRDNYLEDFEPGQVIEHARGHTVSEADNQVLSLLTMNTAQTHFNTDSLRTYLDGSFTAPLLNACVALALAVGLTSEDMSENLLRDVGCDRVRMPQPIVTGDTVYARSTVVAVESCSDRDDAGLLVHDIELRRADGTPVLTARRTVQLKRREAWRERDLALGEHALGAARALLQR
jgi:itaconyl-CoA hydratase